MRTAGVRPDRDPGGSAGAAIPPYLHPLSLDGRAAQRRDDVVGGVLGHFDDRVAVGDVDRPDRPRVDARLVGDRADEIRWPHAGLAAGADPEPRDLEARAARSAGACAALRALFLRGTDSLALPTLEPLASVLL